MKSFNDFWTSLSEDELASMADIATERAASVSTDNPKSALGTQIGVVSTMMTMQLLNKYHDWLSEQL